MNVHLKFLLLIFFASLFEYIGDSNFKIFARNNKSISNLIIGVVIYMLMIGVIIQAFTISNLIYVNTTWDVVSILLEATLAYILLGERLSNNVQKVGFMVIISGLMLFNYGKIPY